MWDGHVDKMEEVMRVLKILTGEEPIRNPRRTGKDSPIINLIKWRSM